MTLQSAATRLRIAAGYAMALDGKIPPAAAAVVDRPSYSVSVPGARAPRSNLGLPSVRPPAETGWPDAALARSRTPLGRNRAFPGRAADPVGHRTVRTS